MDKYTQYKEQVLSYSQKLVREGFLKGTGGNVSIRIKGEEALAITPSNQDYLKITVDEICIVGFDGTRLDGDLKPSIETGFHTAIYEARADVGSVIHTHQNFASALAAMNTPIPAIFDEQVAFLGKEIEVIPYRMSGTQDLVEAVRMAMSSHNNAYLMKNHGAVCLGSDINRAYHNVLLLEKISVSYLFSLTTNTSIDHIPEDIQEMMFAILRDEQKRIEQKINAS